MAFGSVPFSHGALLPLLAEYRRPNDKIAALLARGDLVQLRRGLYLLGSELRTVPLSKAIMCACLMKPFARSVVFVPSAAPWVRLR